MVAMAAAAPQRAVENASPPTLDRAHARLPAKGLQA
jgi:hypothetical protein